MKIVRIICLLILLPLSAAAQQNYAIELTNTRNQEKKVYFNNGDKVTLYNADGIELTGVLNILNTETIVVDSQEVKVNQIPIIINRKSAGAGAKIGGALLMTAGIGISVVGFSILFGALSEGMPTVLYLAPLSILIDYAGLRITSIGFSTIVGKGKRYYLGLDWQIKVIEQ